LSEIKSYSVGYGDMFYINHNSDNFSIIDCCLDSLTAGPILDDLASVAAKKGIVRFISTHPDQDHIRGLTNLDDRLGIVNFYCVANEATKPDPTPDFERYRSLRDSSKAFNIFKGCKRRWMNVSDETRRQSGIEVLWPERANQRFKDALIVAADGGTANGICPIIQYSVENGASVLWMGDLETDFLEDISVDFSAPRTDILFAPHHGRDVVPAGMLSDIDPQLIVIGEAASEHLSYYSACSTLTQNSAGEILFDIVAGMTHVFTTKQVKAPFLHDERQARTGFYYAGTMYAR
jgi:hypothetical protein